ncbi:MAG: peptidoglycan DD-metalloendopeptidase family protein [Gammaproteobacteria bacterium]|nr:peptidoglycan DD-metalloendopeptidase family protein [Gammaproteobacteria bacterium]
MRGLLPRLSLVLAVLLLAGCSGAVRWEEPGVRGSPLPSSREGTAASRPEWHTVLAGETLFSIGSRYGIAVDQLAAWNGLGDGSLIRAGQRLRLTPSGGAPSAASRPAAPAGSEAPPRWQWPVSGPVLARYGESPLTASGIQLGGRAGDAIRAAAGGQVVYAGSGLKGYGELLIIKHSPSWLSAYGYNQALLVAEGERVEAGQQIARMGEGPGTSAAGRRPALHFEIRRNGTPLDPLSQLPRGP